MLDLSVVFGTYNRMIYLVPCIESIREASKGLLYELVIVDGGSTDGTLEYLRGQPNMTLIEHGELKGCVRAYNDGFAASSGKYVAYLNDDMTVRPGMLKAACDVLDEDPTVGLVALRYSNNGAAPVIGYTKINGNRYPFASFGVLRRELGEQAGWFNGYYHYFGDCHLSLSIMDKGYQMHILDGDYWINHFVSDNSVRGTKRWKVNVNAGELSRQDGALYMKEWGAWKGPNNG